MKILLILSKKNNYSTNINNINSINNNPIISSKTPNSIINHKKPSYKKVILNNTKPILNNLDLNLNENIQNLQKVKTKAQIKINYRHISNSNLTQIKENSIKENPENKNDIKKNEEKKNVGEIKDDKEVKEDKDNNKKNQNLIIETQDISNTNATKNKKENRKYNITKRNELRRISH